MTIKEVINECERRGNHFFDPDTMEFWGTEICTELLDNHCFVTADDNFDRSKKLYSVRYYDEDADGLDIIKTVAFQKWDKLKDAVAYAEEC